MTSRHAQNDPFPQLFVFTGQLGLLGSQGDFRSRGLSDADGGGIRRHWLRSAYRRQPPVFRRLCYSQPQHQPTTMPSRSQPEATAWGVPCP